MYQDAFLMYIKAIYEETGRSINQDIQERVTISFFKTYKKYEEQYPVRVKSLDLFKLNAWLPYIFYEEDGSLDSSKLIYISIKFLDQLLLLRGKDIDQNWKKKIKVIACNGFNQDLENISFAKIGLYSLYKTASHTNKINKELPEDLLDTLEGVI